MTCSISDCNMWERILLLMSDCHVVGVERTEQHEGQVEINNVVYLKSTQQLGFLINHDFIYININ